MTDTPRPLPRLRRNPAFVIASAVFLAALAVTLALTGFGDRLATLEVRPHVPDLGLLAGTTPQVKIHLAGALTALAIGTVLMIGVKGTRLHRALGWAWVIAMGTTAVSSLFIKSFMGTGHFGWIHLLSGWTIIGLPMAVYAARRRKVVNHRRAMTGMFVGGLLIAGALAFLPGRLMWEMFF